GGGRSSPSVEVSRACVCARACVHRKFIVLHAPENIYITAEDPWLFSSGEVDPRPSKSARKLPLVPHSH
uniref:Uncharacterized protein n=1 Tax=Aegilops tauschii subsp. strangulata TaxID=200361 RepID=A0A453QQM0_AEGTS